MSGPLYERDAAGWIAWVRMPGHDAYWSYAPAFFAELVPPPRRATLEVGCGEGRVSRDLAARGHAVTGIDVAPTPLAAAREAHAAGRYLLADAAALPFDDGDFDLVVAYNSLMDVDDMPGAVREAARVLEPGGRFCISVTHPLIDAGTFDSRVPDAPFRIRGSYFGRRRHGGTFTRGGLTMTFESWTYPVTDYAEALAGAGFLIEALREPRHEGGDGRKRRIPQFLWLRAFKVDPTVSDTL